MLVLPQFVEITCTPNNKKHLAGKGYFWEYSRKVSVDVLNLSLGSGTEVKVQCDYCLEKGISNVFPKRYKTYLDSIKFIEKVACNKVECMRLKAEETNLLKFGVKNAMQNKEINKKTSSKRRMPYEKVKQLFNDKEYTLITKEYKNNAQLLEYICNRHKYNGSQYITYANLYMNHGCRWCGRESATLKQTGDKSHFWRGGVTSLHTYLRERLWQWKDDSLKFYSNKCAITDAKEDLEIHHLYNFNSIVEDTLHELELQSKSNIGEYTNEELVEIENKCLEIHYRYPLGVCLNKLVHDEFHSIYGKENNTIEQFLEFARNYYNINDFHVGKKNTKKFKFFPHKINATSKYKHVAFIKDINMWRTTILYKRKRIIIGSFDTEYEAAEAYNFKAIELFGENATLNLLDPNDKQPLKEAKKYHDLKSDASSKYFGVTPSNYNMWIARINNNGDRIYLGIFATEWMAAEAYNRKAIELFGEEAIINVLTNDDLIDKANYIPKKKVRSSIYIGVTSAKRDKKWNAYIYNNGKRLSLGYFINEDDAALAYNNKAVELFGDDAELNKVIERVS